MAQYIFSQCGWWGFFGGLRWKTEDLPVTVTCNCLPLGPMIFHHYHGELFMFTIFPTLLFSLCDNLLSSSASHWVYARFVLFIHFRICIAFCSLLFFRPFLDWIFSKENCELAKWSAKFKRKLKRQWQSRLELSLFLPFAPFAPWALFISSFFCLVAEPGLWSSSQDSWAHVACSCIYKCFFTMKLGKWRFSQA